MGRPIAPVSARNWARVAGALYLISILGGAFAIGYVPAIIVVSGDAAATTRNLVDHQLLYRLGLATHVVVLSCNVPLAVIFYDLFKVVNRRLAMAVVFFTLVATAMEGANLLVQFTPLVVLGGGPYLSSFNDAQLQALAYIPFQLQKVAYNLQQVIFGFYGLAIGYLVFRSTFMPRVIGVLLVAGGLSYLTYSFASFLAPAFAAGLVPYIQLPSLIGEGSLCVSLLASGVNVQRWSEQAGALAAPPAAMAALGKSAGGEVVRD